MSPLSFVLTLASIVFLFFAIDGMQRRKVNFLHFLIFFGGSLLILAFVFIPGFEGGFSRIFGVARGADLIVYSALIVLGYFYFELLHEVTKQKSQTTRIITAESIRNLHIKKISHSNDYDSFVFLIRAYNEQHSIGNVIDTIIQAGFSKIVIVNDGSSDNTVGVVEEAQSRHHDAHIYLISHLINRGGGAANKTGFACIQKYYETLGVERLVTYDADGQMDINDMKTFMKAIKDNHNKAIKAYLGTRFIHGGSAKNMPNGRKIILWGSKIVTRLFNRLNVSDPHNGYRVLHVDILKQISLTSDGMMYASELLDSIRIHDIPFTEIPVHIQYTQYSLTKGQKNRNALKILAEIIYKKIFFK